MRHTRRSRSLAALAAGAGVLAACAGVADAGSAPPGEFITTLDGDGGPPVAETYVGTPGTSTMYLNYLTNVDPDVRASLHLQRVWLRQGSHLHLGPPCTRRLATHTPLLPRPVPSCPDALLSRRSATVRLAHQA
jgi:hypothetical protein